MRNRKPTTRHRLASRLGVLLGLSALLLAPSAPTNATVGWTSADLTQITGAPPAAGNNIFGYTTSLIGQGPVARVVYRTGNGLPVTPPVASE